MILWYALRSISSKKFFFNLSTLFSVISLALGVATLVTAMSLINGYELALKSSVYDVFGHFILTRSPQPIYGVESEIASINEVTSLKPGTKYSPFIHKEVLAVNKGKLLGALIEGLDAKTFQSVSAVDRRILSGTMDLEKAAEEEAAYIGKDLAANLEVEVGESFAVVIPYMDDTGQLRRRVKRLKVLGLLDLGKYEYNNRYILTEIQWARDFVGFSETASTGLRFKFKDPEEAEVLQTALLGSAQPYMTQTWKAVNSSLFEAIRFEKVVLFLILSIMIIVAAFNLTTGLFLNVYRKILDVSVLRTLGLQKKEVFIVFIFQGLYIGVWGYLAGLALGFVQIGLLNLIISSGLFLPPEVYKLNTLVIQPKALDLVLILIASLVICFVASISPARKSVNLKPAEGLRYD